MKWDINQGLRSFNSWFDDFILVAAKPLAMLGFAMGTVDIFVRGVLATAYWFELSWAIVQALTIDGLFFTVWWRIFAFKWSWQTALSGLGLVGIGVILELVAMATNGILGMQQLWGLADSQQAMIRLGVDPFYFSVVRAVLVVSVSTMVAFVTYKSQAEKGENVSENVSENQVRVSEAPILSLAPPHEKSESDQILTGDRVREAARTAVQTDKGLNLNQFSRETGIPLSTLYRWKKEAPV